ncbi:unnamed protein product [Phytophthora fragariaefolia]|uniref:Unnamed protein product n=1 Tax=Phytophthora fragariaefolia TaxID=1490495 RepID=A0A9W6TGK6_9STRA|nr:unnamed protein product [Phytophthora fragariaefolia]
MEEETLRLQFGSAATTIGSQWLALQATNAATRAPHVLAFEAKGRVRRRLSVARQPQEDPSTWGGGVQVYDQSGPEPAGDDGLWSWARLGEHNLVEVDEFRPHMPLHNFYEGRAASNGGNIGNATMDEAENRVRAVLETCDQLRLVQGLVDMDSSWGGLAYEVMTYVAEECPGAVTVVVGNDWSYPLATDDDDAVFRVASEVRDRTKIEGRKRINVASSVALLSEIAGLLVPVAMSPSTLPATRFPRLRFDRSSCAEASTVVATALELAMSAYRGRSAYEILEGFQPSMKVAELAASFPHTSDPVVLLQRISENATAEVSGTSSSADDPFEPCSLLPIIQQRATRRLDDDEVSSYKTHYRRFHFRGAFGRYPSLRCSLDTFAVSPRAIALQWSDATPLTLPDTYRLQSLANTSIDAISQLSSSSNAGNYLSTLAQRVAKNDKRTLYEFTRADICHVLIFFFTIQQHHEEELVEVHLNNIAELAEFRVNGKLAPMSQLEVSCKNFELVKFNFPGEAVSGDVYVKVNQVLMDKLQPAAYAFARQPDTSGWAAYDPQAEFTRLGFKTPKSGAQIGGFRITHVNNNYKMSPTYPSAFVSTRWLEHVRSVLVSCSICVAQLVEGTSLMIHCSDGWDRTAQITALVKLCADPFYRTVKGFQVLIEQEWCGFGHQFRARSGHTDTQAAYWEDDNTSPVFMQFVDAVWQLMRQFPCSFEFNERYLIALLDEVYNKRSGTFLHDCEEARMVRPLFSILHAVCCRVVFCLSACTHVIICHDQSISPTVFLHCCVQDAWAKELQVTQRELQDQLSAAHQQLQCQVEQNSGLQSELERLRRESAQLHRLLEGEVYSDTMNGVLVHEEDDDEDGVVLSVTPVGESRTTLQPSCSDSDSSVPGMNEAKVFSTTGVGCFLGASMSQDFEILQSYFDPKRHDPRALDPTAASNGCANLFPPRRSMGVEEAVR